MTRPELLAESVLMSKQLLARYLAGFNDVSHVRQTPDLPNHLAWQLGHLAHTMHRIAEKLDGKPMPTEHFVTGDGTAGSRDKGVFDTEQVCFASRPEERHDRYPKLDRAIEIFNASCDRLAAAARTTPDATLDELTSWGANMQIPLWAAVLRMVYHNGFHTGQIADLRRALGFRPVLM